MKGKGSKGPKENKNDKKLIKKQAEKLTDEGHNLLLLALNFL
jgi:hypothetical protein